MRQKGRLALFVLLALVVTQVTSACWGNRAVLVTEEVGIDPAPRASPTEEDAETVKLFLDHHPEAELIFIADVLGVIKEQSKPVGGMKVNKEYAKLYVLELVRAPEVDPISLAQKGGMPEVEFPSVSGIKRGHRVVVAAKRVAYAGPRNLLAYSHMTFFSGKSH